MSLSLSFSFSISSSSFLLSSTSEETVRSLRVELKIASKELAEASSQLLLARDEEAKLVVENKALITESMNREITLKEVQSEAERRESIVLRDLEALRSDITSKEKQLIDVTEGADEKLSKALQENEKAEAEILKMRNANKALKTQLDSSVAEMDSCRTDGAIEKDELQRLVLREKDLSNQCSQLETQRVALLKEIRGASSKVMEGERKIEELLESIASSKGDIDSIHHEMSSVKEAAAAAIEGLNRLLEESRELLRDSERAKLLMAGDSVDKLAEVTKVSQI